MPVNEETNGPMLVLEEVRSLYKQKQSEEPAKLHWEYTYDSRQSVNFDLMSMYEGCIPSEAVSDIEFLTETNKQYAELGLNPKLDRQELGLNPKLDRPDDNNTDFNNNKNKRKSLYLDGSFYGDISKCETNEDFKTFYDITTGETKVMLGSYEYIIDTSYFGESEADSLHDKTTFNYDLLKPEEQILKKMKFSDAQRTMMFPEVKRQTNETETCVHTTVSMEEEKRKHPSHETDNGPNTVPNRPIKPTNQSRTSAMSSFIKSDCTKMLPPFETFNNSIESESFRSNCNMNTSMRECRWYEYLQDKTRHISALNCTNGNENAQTMFSYSTEWLNSLSYECPYQHQTSSGNPFNTSLKEKKIASSSAPCVGTNSTFDCEPASLRNQIHTHQRGMVSDQYNQNAFQPTPCAMHLPSGFSDFNKYRHLGDACSETAKTRSSPAEPQMNKGAFEVTKLNPKRKWKRGCRLWEYIRNLLIDPNTNPVLIKWVDRNEGTFKLVQNKTIAHMWGMKKGNGDMSYEKLSRAMRYYYKKQIFQPVIGKRLVYKFGPRATGWREDN